MKPAFKEKVKHDQDGHENVQKKEPNAFNTINQESQLNLRNNLNLNSQNPMPNFNFHNNFNFYSSSSYHPSITTISSAYDPR